LIWIWYEISSGWIKDVLGQYSEAGILKVELSRLNSMVLSDVRSWLKGSEIDYKKVCRVRKEHQERDLMLAEILTALALSRKSIWAVCNKEADTSSPLEIYSTLELNNRIIFSMTGSITSSQRATASGSSVLLILSITCSTSLDRI
jgi:hypothetical protein